MVGKGEEHPLGGPGSEVRKERELEKASNILSDGKLEKASNILSDGDRNSRKSKKKEQE